MKKHVDGCKSEPYIYHGCYYTVCNEEGYMGRLISLAELATRTGTCESTWRKKIARGELPVVRLGRAIRIAEHVAERIMRDGTQTKVLTERVA
jgi:excisionase family DNA binding protein